MFEMRMDEWEWIETDEWLISAETFCLGIKKSLKSQGVCFLLCDSLLFVQTYEH